MKKFRSGIYKITIGDRYIYIGQSMDVENRWKQHLNKLKANKHRNIKFQNVFNKYPDSIKFEIIEECDVDKLDEREMHWIAFYRSFGSDHGLNMSIGGDNGRRKYKTREEREAARKQWYTQYNRQYYRDNKEKRHPYYRQYHTQYYQNNKSKIKEYSKKYRYDNIEYCKQYDTRYRRQKGIISKKEKFEIRHNLNRPLTDREWDIWCNTKYKFKRYVIKFLKSLPNITFTTPSKKQKGILSCKEKFEKRYNLSRPLTSEEWNTWITDKSISGCHSKKYAIKYLKILPNITFTIPPKK